METVRALATAGARVILTSRSLPAGEKVAKELKDSGVKVPVMLCMPCAAHACFKGGMYEPLHVRAG